MYEIDENRASERKNVKLGQRESAVFIFTSLSKLISLYVASIRLVYSFVHSLLFVRFVACLLTCSFVCILFSFLKMLFTRALRPITVLHRHRHPIFFVCICICKFEIFAHLVQNTHKTSMC